MLRRLAAAALVSTLGLVASAAPAWAHVEVEPEEAVAGATQALTFRVEYEGSATTGLTVRLPAGASVADVPTKAGWTSAVDEAERTVSWSGGSATADDAFSVVVELPARPGVVLFPTIQQTAAGEVPWIEAAESVGEEGRPAPRLTLTADPNAPSTTTTQPTTTTAEPATTTTDADLPGTTLEAQERDDGSSSAAPWLIGSALVAAAAIAIGGTILKRRSG